jgi:hypothetical protein
VVSDEPILGAGLTSRRVRVAREDVAWLRYVLEGHDGLANLHGASDGTITLVTTDGLADELDAVIAELGLVLEG